MRAHRRRRRAPQRLTPERAPRGQPPWRRFAMPEFPSPARHWLQHAVLRFESHAQAPKSRLPYGFVFCSVNSGAMPARFRSWPLPPGRAVFRIDVFSREWRFLQHLG